MASEIRVNKIANRAGLSTVQYTDTGIIVSGIVTCTEISGINALNIAGVSTFASPLDINGDIDVDGHTNLDNLSVAGVSTFTGAVNTTNVVVGDFLDVGSNIKLGNAGVITATSFSGDGSSLTGIAATTNVRTNSLEVSGVSTFSDDVTFTGAGGNIVFDKSNNSLTIKDGCTLNFGDGDDLRIFHGGAGLANATFIDENGSGRLRIRSNDYVEIGKIASAEMSARFFADGAVELYWDNGKKFETTQAGAIVTGILTATSFSGDGSSLSNLPAGAPVGGASTNTVFFENDKEVAVNYQITSTKNAMTAGPVAINAGIAVTVPSGCAWTIV